MSTFCEWNGNSGKGERGIRRSVFTFPGDDAGSQENILRTVTKVECYHSGLGPLCVCRECWISPGFTVFYWRKEERK